jgi:hypothetical protein
MGGYLLDSKILGGNSNFVEKFLAEILAIPRVCPAGEFSEDNYSCNIP